MSEEAKFAKLFDSPPVFGLLNKYNGNSLFCRRDPERRITFWIRLCKIDNSSVTYQTHMRRLLQAILLIILVSDSLFGQIIIEGKILDKNTRRPISYANLGVVNSNVGTISNPDGSFSIIIPQRLRDDTLTFSALGFSKRAIAVSDLNQRERNTIFLDERPILLETITINERRGKSRTFELGNAAFRGGVIETDTTYAGRAVALLIENREPFFQKDLQFPVYFEKARLRIFKNNLDSFKFRIRLNEIDSVTGQPGSDLLQQSIVVESTMRKGWLEFDLTSLGLQINGPFFITFEQILDLIDRIAITEGYRKFMTEHPEQVVIDTVESDGEKTIRKRFKGSGIDLPGTFIAIATSQFASENYSCFVRETSMGEWKKVRGIVTATVLFTKP